MEYSKNVCCVLLIGLYTFSVGLHVKETEPKKATAKVIKEYSGFKGVMFPGLKSESSQYLFSVGDCMSEWM